jgi:hypothetical protein
LDIGTVFQVVAGSLESQLALDFACICLYEHADHCLTVACVGTRSTALAQAVAMPERVRIPIDENGLSGLPSADVDYRSGWCPCRLHAAGASAHSGCGR